MKINRKIKQCPFKHCQNTELEIVQRYSDSITIRNYVYYVFCKKCGSCGPVEKSKSWAVRKYNARISTINQK